MPLPQTWRRRGSLCGGGEAWSSRGRIDLERGWYLAIYQCVAVLFIFLMLLLSVPLYCKFSFFLFFVLFSCSRSLYTLVITEEECPSLVSCQSGRRQVTLFRRAVRACIYQLICFPSAHFFLLGTTPLLSTCVILGGLQAVGEPLGWRAQRCAPFVLLRVVSSC